jgi:hypothetical protein
MGVGVVNCVNGTQVSFVVTNVMNAQIRDGGITTDMLDDLCVTTAKLADEATTTAKLADNAVTTPKIINDAVTTPKIVDQGITTDKLAQNAVTNDKLATGSVADENLIIDSTIYRLRGNIPSNVTSLQAVRGSGTWTVPSTQLSSITDMPSGYTNVNHTLMNFVYSNSGNNQASMQFIYPNYGTKEMWWRFTTASSAGSWYSLINDGTVANNTVTDPKINSDATIYRLRGAIPSNVTSLQTVRSAGTWQVLSAQLPNITDMPSGYTNVNHTLMNFVYSDSSNNQASMQFIYPNYNANKMWWRYTTASNAGPWYSLIDIKDENIDSNSSIVRFIGILQSDTTSLASITKSGTYNVPLSVVPNLSDLPSEASLNNTYCLINNTYAQNGAIQYPVQTLVSLYGYFGIWTRIVGNNSVSNWMKIYPQTNVSVLSGKKLVTAGDSYTAALFGSSNPKTGHNFGWYIAQRNGMTFVNSGISGSIMALDKTHVADPNNVPITTRDPFSYQRYLEVPADTDYLTIWFGINDAAHTNLGTINDTTNETFYGAWNVVLEYYLTNRPCMHVGIVITVQSTEEYRQAVRDVAAKWGYPVLDLTKGPDTPAFFDRDDMSETARDLRRDAYGCNTRTRHPNPEWHEFISGAFEEFLKRC